MQGSTQGPPQAHTGSVRHTQAQAHAATHLGTGRTRQRPRTRTSPGRTARSRWTSSSSRRCPRTLDCRADRRSPTLPGCTDLGSTPLGRMGLEWPPPSSTDQGMPRRSQSTGKRSARACHRTVQRDTGRTLPRLPTRSTAPRGRRHRWGTQHPGHRPALGSARTAPRKQRKRRPPSRCRRPLGTACRYSRPRQRRCPAGTGHPVRLWWPPQGTPGRDRPRRPQCTEKRSAQACRRTVPRGTGRRWRSPRC